jgi:hypothetical protein
MKRRLIRFLYIFLLLALLAGCAGTPPGVPADTTPRINPPLTLPAGLASFPAIQERHPDVPDDYEPAAETELLRLYYRKVSSAIIVEDKRSGALWHSSPADLADNTGTTASWRNQIEVPVQFTYVDAERAQSKTLRPERIGIETSPVQDGMQAVYTLDTTGIQFAVQYTLQDDCLRAILPDRFIKEESVNSLVNVEVLGFFGATHDNEPGYIFYPDGSGALMRFDTIHPEEVQRITSVIYGADASGGGLRPSTGTAGARQQVVMPVFGLSRGDSAYVAIISQGDFDTSVNVARSGKGINYNRVWAQLVFRRQGRFSLTGGQPAWLYQPDRIIGDREVRFCFLNDNQASYVGMASRYRDYLMKELGAQRMRHDTSLMHIGIFMGTERRTWFLSDMVSMTTFEDAREMLNDLAQAGVKDIDVTLWMWNQGFTSGKYPERLPVDSRLGGEKGLLSLSKDMHQRGQRLFLQDNYLLVAPGAKNVMPYVDAIRGVDGLPIGSNDQGYLLNPQVAMRRFAGRDFPKMANLGADGLMLESFASLALPDKNSVYPLSRESFAATWMQIADMARKQFGAVSMEGGNVYALPYADRLDFVSLDSTHYDIFDETIPFYHIATHGLVQYSSAPHNLISDGQRMWLRQIEYGAIPVFVLTKDSSAQLMRTGANGIFSSQYSYWRDEVIRQYKEMESLSPLSNQFIVGHERLAEKVFQTVYEDGSKIIVNYRTGPYTLGTLTIPAQDFVLVRGD